MTGLQASSDDLIQAQISATGGILPGPASGLSAEDYNSLATNLRTMAATGGRLSSSLKRGQQSDLLDIAYELTPLAQKEFEEELNRQKATSALEILRQTGGQVGGYYDARGNFVEGDTFEKEAGGVSFGGHGTNPELFNIRYGKKRRDKNGKEIK